MTILTERKSERSVLSLCSDEIGVEVGDLLSSVCVLEVWGERMDSISPCVRVRRELWSHSPSLILNISDKTVGGIF